MSASLPSSAPPLAPSPGLDARLRVSPKFRLQWEEVQQSWVLLYPEGMVKLNRSAGEILARCDGTRSLAAIIAELETAFDASGLQADVLAFIELAQRQHWVQVAP